MYRSRTYREHLPNLAEKIGPPEPRSRFVSFPRYVEKAAKTSNNGLKVKYAANLAAGAQEKKALGGALAALQTQYACGEKRL